MGSNKSNFNLGVSLKTSLAKNHGRCQKYIGAGGSTLWNFYTQYIRACLAPRNCQELLCNLEILPVSKISETPTVWQLFQRLFLGMTFWKLLVSFGNGLKLFLHLLFNS